MNPRRILVLVTVCTLSTASPVEEGLKFLKHVYQGCSSAPDFAKCLKIRTLKIIDRATHLKTVNILNGVRLVSDSRQGRELPLNQTNLQDLDEGQLNHLLIDSTARFIDGHQFEISISKLVEEGRRRKNRGGWGLMLGALAIKGTLLTMAYQGIAVMSGTAIIVGKMALLLSAILGLKKLVSGGGEKTTFEIVKVPKYSESHTHSTSHEDEGHYYRSINLNANGP